ncbi:cyclic nucleotide-binding domain-containing protein [Streptomyces sp. NPDC002643]
MINAPTPSILRALPAEHRQRLMRFAREVSVPQGTRLFEEGGKADRFWIIRTGTVELDMHVPGSTIAQWVGDVLAHRLRSARTRLLDMYAPYGAGNPV